MNPTEKHFKSRIALIFITAMVIFILGLFVGLCSSCKKKTQEPVKTQTPAKTCYDINLAKDVNWHPIYSGYDSPFLSSDGKYYESGNLKGTWAFQCDCVVVSNPTIAANNFYFRIANLSAETLQVYTARFGVTLFYK